MTRIIKSITVEVRCAATFVFGDRCEVTADATIVSPGKGSGDLALYPVGWGTEVRNGYIEAVCPEHKEKP